MNDPATNIHQNDAARDRQPDWLFDRELKDAPAAWRWREWMNRVEAVIFASGKPVGREMLARVIGASANLDQIIDDIQEELKGRPYELIQVADGWMHRTKPQYTDAIKIAADIGDKQLDLNEMEMAVLASVAYHQPISRKGLADIFGKQVNRDLLHRLRMKELITNGPRDPRPGAPHTFVTTTGFLATFDMQSLRDLPELE
jgi:segregation and condensation protein B